MRLLPLFLTLAKSQNFTCYVGDENELSIDSSCESEIGCFRNQVKTEGKFSQLSVIDSVINDYGGLFWEYGHSDKILNNFEALENQNLARKSNSDKDLSEVILVEYFRIKLINSTFQMSRQ